VPAQEAFTNVIKAIAQHEKVVVGINPSLYKKLAPSFRMIPNVEPISIRYNDAWARDNMALFVTNGKSIRSVDFRFNAWGGSFDGLYRNYKDDDRLAAVVSKRMKLLSYYLPNFVLEGGSIAVDGEGTLITTEACLLSKGRNPTFRKAEIEEVLRDYLGVEKVIWVPHGIYQDETDEHVDNMVSFVKPGEVVMAWTEDQNDPQYAYCQATYEALAEAVDAKGRKLVIHKLMLPSPALYFTPSDTKGLINNASTLDKREAGRRLAASYVNYYQGKDFIILPAFGVKEDALALKTIQELYPNKTVHQVLSREILLGGGNIHCITMQIPEKEE
jgi:agmatine deiminase